MLTQTQAQKLSAAGWQVGNADDFLRLSPEESLIVSLRVSLAQAVKQARSKKALTQAALAKLMKSSQSRVAKIEGADASVSLELMLQALVLSGAKTTDINRALKIV